MNGNGKAKRKKNSNESETQEEQEQDQEEQEHQQQQQQQQQSHQFMPILMPARMATATSAVAVSPSPSLSSAVATASSSTSPSALSTVTSPLLLSTATAALSCPCFTATAIAIDGPHPLPLPLALPLPLLLPLAQFPLHLCFDWLFAVFDFLTLHELSRLWRCCFALSHSHWRYRFQQSHQACPAAIIECFQHFDHAYEKYSTVTDSSRKHYVDNRMHYCSSSSFPAASLALAAPAEASTSSLNSCSSVSVASLQSLPLSLSLSWSCSNTIEYRNANFKPTWSAAVAMAVPRQQNQAQAQKRQDEEERLQSRPHSLRKCMKSSMQALRISAVLTTQLDDSFFCLSSILDNFHDIDKLAVCDTSTRDSLRSLTSPLPSPSPFDAKRLPKRLQHLELMGDMSRNFICALPQSLKILKLSMSVYRKSDNLSIVKAIDWPPSLTSLSVDARIVDNYWNSWRADDVAPVAVPNAWQCVEFPTVDTHPQLTHLHLTVTCSKDSQYHDIFDFPLSLRSLTLKRSDHDHFPLAVGRCRLLDQLELQLHSLTALHTLNLHEAGTIMELQPHVLPDSITHLLLPYYYNFPLLPHVLPPRLRQLHLHGDYNHPLSPGALPRTVERLWLSLSFNCQLSPGSLPPALLLLGFRSNYSFAFTDGVLPSTLLELHMPCESFWLKSTSLEMLRVSSVSDTRQQCQSHSQSQSELQLQTECHSLPDSLTKLFLTFSVSCAEFIVPGELPPRLESLDLDFNPNVSNTFNASRPIPPTVLPGSLRSLTFHGFSRALQPGILPEGLTRLKLCYPFKSPFTVGVLPESLRDLDLSEAEDFDEPFLNGVLPAHLECLRLGVQFRKPLYVAVLPVRLRQLVVFSAACPIISLPTALTALHLTPYYLWQLPRTLSTCVSLQELKCPVSALLAMQDNDFPPSLLNVYLISLTRYGARRMTCVETIYSEALWAKPKEGTFDAQMIQRIRRCAPDSVVLWSEYRDHD